MHHNGNSTAAAHPLIRISVVLTAIECRPSSPRTMGRPYPSLLNGRLLGIGSLAHLASAIKERFRLNGQDFRDYVTRYLGSRFYRKQFFDLDLSCNVAHDLGVADLPRGDAHRLPARLEKEDFFRLFPV